ncbi:MAG: hypothetical protein R3Y06_11905 [Faecalibacterium sp.]
MDNEARKVRMEQWAGIVSECNRSGQKKKEWCAERQISIKSFYYWQKLLRAQAVEQMQNGANNMVVSNRQEVVPLTMLEERKQTPCGWMLESAQPGGAFSGTEIQVLKGDCKIVFSENTSPQYIASFVKALV